MNSKKSFGVPSMKMYPYTSPVRPRHLAPHEQVDVGEYIGIYLITGDPVVRIYVDYELVSPSGGLPVLHEPVSIQTTEHWVFLGDQPYDSAAPLSVQRIGPASGMVHTSLAAFLSDMATKNVTNYLIAKAVTLPPPSPEAAPSINQSTSAILGEGAYHVSQKGQRVGAILATKQAEHWGVTRSYDIEIGFDVEPIRDVWDYARWAAWVNSNFDPCIYWVVMGEVGKLPQR
jgi:hypothetical protein